MKRFRPLKPDSLGLIIHYECTFRCEHCLYACRPGLKEDVRTEDLDRILDVMAHTCPGAYLHVGGGEPFLHLDRLVHTVKGIRRRAA